MNKFKTVKVKDIGRVITGNTPPTLKREFYGNKHIFIKPTDMSVGERFVLETEEYYSDLAYEKYKKALIPPFSTCVVTIGSLGKKLCLSHDYCFTNQAVNSIIPYNNYDKHFVYYLFKYVNPAVENLSNGTASGRDNVSKTSFENLNVIVPVDKQYQESIASILSAYDDLIEVNSQRIKLLEQTARELYKEWFVRMRFPNYKKAKFNKGVPDKWEIEKVKAIVDRHKFGRTYKPEELEVTGSIVVVDQSKKDLLGYHNNEPDHKASLEKPMIIFGDHTCKMQLMVEDFSLAENVIPISSKNEMPIYFLYYLIESLVETIEYKRHWNDLVTKSVLIPTGDLQKKYSKIVNPFFDQINILIKQNNQLRQIRDRLLPRLISGKLQVKTAKEETKVVPLEPTKGKFGKGEKVNISNPYFTRRVLAAYLIDHLKDEATFGHVKLMKLMYLCEHLAKVETLSNYHRDAAGPYDNQMIRSIDSQLKKAKWFECIKIDQKYTYRPLEKKDEYKDWFAKYYSEEESGIESLITIFGKRKTIETEKVATLYEAHRFLNESNKHFTDKDVLNEVLNNWHESKQRISENEWQSCLNWMREKRWIK